MKVHFGDFGLVTVLVLAFNLFELINCHIEASVSTSSSAESLESESEERFTKIPEYRAKNVRRSYNKRKQFEGMSIDYKPSNRRQNAIQTTARTTEATTRILPPLDPKYRRIYNPDETTRIQDNPYMAALLFNNELWCGAVIVDRNLLLTAAHCLQLQYNNRFFREYVKMLTVRVGSSNSTSGGEVYQVNEIFFHPNYKAPTLEYNVAVIRLHRNLTVESAFNKVGTIDYRTETVIPNDAEIEFLGWGSVLGGIGGVGGQVLLQKVKLPIYDLADCQEIYGRDLVTRNNFCAGYISKAKNVCNHDAGGPAILDGLLVGILSFSSQRCDLADKPAVFTNVGMVSKWLDNIREQRSPLYWYAG